MFETLVTLLPNEKTRNVASTAAGMLGVLAGRKVSGLTLFAKGIHGLEKEWRKNHPDFQGGIEERWQRAVDFYEQTHANPVNRKLHIIGIPMILGGTAGLLLFNPYRPLWFMAASSFTFGWALNIVGHGLFEKNAPAFADDPLSFLAGPAWDFKNLFGGRAKRSSAQRSVVETVETPAGPITVINVEPSEPAQA
jgi:hypothetical protein